MKYILLAAIEEERKIFWIKRKEKRGFVVVLGLAKREKRMRKRKEGEKF